MKPPDLVVAADWSVSPGKRWMTRAQYRRDGSYLISAPEPVGETKHFLGRLEGMIFPRGTALVGFDFPLGLPEAYASEAGLTGFRQSLALFGRDGWGNFFRISGRPGLRNPFYPPLPAPRGAFKQKTLIQALGLKTDRDLFRRCEKESPARPECLFWTLGGKQVGRAAISGWREVIQPGLAGDNVRLWPFDGDLDKLLRQPGLVLCEIYPGEAYAHLGFRMGVSGRSKRRKEDRLAVAESILSQADRNITFAREARDWISGGFKGEDDFDAMAGLLVMLKVVLGRLSDGLPRGRSVRRLEGWILGQQGAAPASRT